jgi:acetyl-CoA carboxylase carboxyl transferase subunit beta
MEKTKLKDAVRTGLENPKEEVVICCMDFAFIGGSMGAVVGEKISRGINHSIKTNPFMISKSGGARMMEAAYSLMQCKTSVKLAQLAEENLTFHYVQTLLLEERLHLMLC